MTHRTLARLLIALGAVIALTACSDEEPPDWLRDLAAEVETTATSAPTTTTTTTTTPAPGRGEATGALELAAGTCVVEAPFIQGQPVEVVSLPTVDCAEPHQAEVYDIVQLPQQLGEPFPGDGLAPQARDECLGRFEAFVGVPWTASELEFVALRPTELSWAEGDRAIVCVVFRPDGQELVGSLFGAAY